ncbi:hypothetical protein WHX56_20435 [Achromobacter veterisilvae]|jgi:hypothetical protein|uniref:Uncharacterized protein n=1 Tax=Achromobacter veterisilvae TaxID=2069367 RepID=A0ABZ2RV81_9BURK|nr:hypothetical protein [Achromobacter veterisilvae]
MFDFQYDAGAFREIVDELVPGYQRSIILSALESAADSDKDFDAIGLGLTGEQVDAGLMLLTGTGSRENRQSMWGAIKAELFDLFCTASKKYSNERKDGIATIKHVVLIIATAVAAQFHVAVGVVVGAVTVAVMGALKITRNAWCEVNRPAKQ